jgi:DNA-binding GntR family transcriptional regulator
MYLSDFKIERDSPIPYYYQLEGFLRTGVEKGFLKKNDTLPSEKEIAETCDVSIGVVRQALQRLEQSGIINRQKGKKAIVVSDPKVQIEFSHKQYGGYEDLQEQGLKVGTTVLENRLVVPDDRIASKLQLECTQEVIKIVRTRAIEDRKVIYWISYVPARLCPALEQYDLTDKSLNRVVAELYGIQTHTVECSLEVVRGEQEICEVIGRPAYEPLIYIECTNYLRNGRVFQFSEAWHTADNWKFIFHLYPDLPTD